MQLGAIFINMPSIISSLRKKMFFWNITFCFDMILLKCSFSEYWKKILWYQLKLCAHFLLLGYS